MFNRAGPDHIQVDVYQTPDKAISPLYCCCMVPVFPESTFSILSDIVLLGCAACDQLEALGQSLAVPRILYKKMNVVRCDGVIQYT